MKKYIYISALALTSALTFSSCDDFLEAENKSSGGVTADEYYATEEGLESFMATAYSGLKWMATNTEINEWGTDLYVDVRNGDPGEFHKYTFSAENGTIESLYVNTYAMINNANGVLFYGGEESKFADEAKFLRCYGYYLLTQHFGGVPYVTEYINNDERNYPRMELGELYSHLITELEELATSDRLPEESLGANVGRASKRAAAALLAKVYLAAGWDIQTSLTNAAKGTYEVKSTEYFKEAAKWAKTAINGQQLTLSFQEKWWPFNENNAEEIFSVQYQREGFPGDIATGGHNLQGAFGHMYGGPTDSGLKACGSALCPSTKAIYLWDKGDERWTGTFMQVMYNSTKKDGVPTWGTEGYYAYYNNADNSHLNIAFAYFPYYVTQKEVEDWVAANPDRFTHSGNMANARAGLFIMADPMVLMYVNENGEIASKSVEEYHTGGTKAQAGVTVRKYDDPNTLQSQNNNNSCYRDIVVLHLSELYLTAAEANLMAGEEKEALNYLNAVRKRAKATELTSFGAYSPMYLLPENYEVTALDVVLDERARELFGENEGRWVDLRRTKQLVRYNVTFNDYINSVADMSNNRGEVKWLRPIPQGDISTNEGIAPEDQNPGY